jgi:hypothetical protein
VPFEQSPLEVLDPQARMSRLYDEWVLEEILHRPVLDVMSRAYYRLFVAEAHKNSTCSLEHGVPARLDDR